MIFPNKKYSIVYADPPWSYNDNGPNRRGGSGQYYPSMSLEDICNLDVSQISDENCVLFLWATFPNLQESLITIKSWGFEYKTIAFNWVKKNKKSDSWFWGMGNWTRSNSEICLLATRGKPKRMSAGVHSVIDTPIQHHSKKPDIIREKIVELCGDLSRIELFARQKTEGWEVWGNEV